MPTFQIGLAQNLPNRNPSRFQARYTYRNGNTQTWWLENVNPDRNAALVNADCAADLVNQVDVLTRAMISHYPDMPNTVETQITSVQR
jgi:hypothetical protein